MYDSQKRANAKWKAANYKRLLVDMPAAEYSAMDEHISGRCSRAGFVREAIREKIARETAGQDQLATLPVINGTDEV